MKKLLSLVLTLTLAFSLAACTNSGTTENSDSVSSPASEGIAPAENESSAEEASQPETEAGSASLVVYFSWSGNTESVANEIQAQTGADLFEIVPAEPYTDDYDALLDIAQEEQANGARPAIAETVENFEQYDTVYFGFPNWWYGVPMALLSFLDHNDLSGKQVCLFCSHGTGGLANSVEIITEAVPDAEISDNIFDCYEEEAAGSEEVIIEWVNELGY